MISHLLLIINVKDLDQVEMFLVALGAEIQHVDGLTCDGSEIMSFVLLQGFQQSDLTSL